MLTYETATRAELLFVWIVHRYVLLECTYDYVLEINKKRLDKKTEKLKMVCIPCCTWGMFDNWC